MLGKDPIPNYLSFQYAATSRSDRSRTIRNPEKTGPGAAPAEFHFHGFRIGHYRCHFDIATALSQADRHSVTAVLEEICYFEFRRFVPDTGRDRAIGTNQAVGKRQTKYAPTLFHILSIIPAVSGGVIKIIKFSFPAKSCISIYPG